MTVTHQRELSKDIEVKKTLFPSKNAISSKGSGKMRTRKFAHGNMRTEGCARGMLRTERYARKLAHEETCARKEAHGCLEYGILDW